MTRELLDVVIQSRDEQGLGVAVFELHSPSSAPLPEFAAGAHVDVHVDSDTIRQYSLCSDPADVRTYRIGVLNDPNSRGGSVKIHQQFVVGKTIQISKPRNHFPLNNNTQRTILAGGGIGITPMIAMAYEMQSQGRDFEIHYCMRTEGAGAFFDELQQAFSGKVNFHYDDGTKEQLFSPEDIFSPYDKNTHIYVCGPSGFMDWVIDSAKTMAYPPEQVHFEYFNAEVDTTGASFEVYCAKSDVTVNIGEEQTIAKALAEAGVKVDVSCEEGVCGTCITDVLDGVPDHRDHFLTEEERDDNDQMALCCSRSKGSRLVIDI